MREITTSELECMEVINLCDGGKLGYPSAVELCVEDGKITALIIPRECGFLGFGKSEHYRIPWCRIECFGEDTVLVKLTAAELSNCIRKGSGKRK
jgi:YlmC/YmxH family sporulation protein